MMTDTDTDIEMTREAIADDEMHASPRLNSLKEITALWHLCSRVLRLYISNEVWQEVGYIDKKSSSHKTAWYGCYAFGCGVYIIN
jgi:hypothetical protein